MLLQVPLATSTNAMPLNTFWKSLTLYHDRPNLVNRRLVGISQVLFYRVTFNSSSIKKISEIFTKYSILYEIRKLECLSQDLVTESLVRSIIEPYDKNAKLFSVSSEEFNNSTDEVFISVRILLPKQKSFEKCIEFAIFDKEHNSVTFIAVAKNGKGALAPPFAYSIEINSRGITKICVENFEDADTNSAEWLCDQLFPHLLKWAENADGGTTNRASLSLISVHEYYEAYHELKNKYGQTMVKIWPESTDPLKFVYEDVAIASYLISLWWKINPEKRPTFVDLGCGNGLLVHILNQEGYRGIGVDVRRRKIWDLYPSSTANNLQVKTIIPSASSLFPDADWIIGNHSDELTPWIPIIAARSSYKTNFFLLPCCTYDFSGKKYQRLNSSKSQYFDYLDYVRDICKKCGFITEVDKLRIPSTKRTCIVGYERFYKKEEFTEIDKGIAAFINIRTQNSCSLKDPSDWVQNFEPREQTEKVRNCTQLDKNLISKIICTVSECLLSEENLIMKSNGKAWNHGRIVLLSFLSSCIPKNVLKQLKSECGGLQTLLKNHRYIFNVKHGSVQFRVPQAANEKNSKYRTKICWFYENHPDGCLLEDDVCCYKHL